MHSIRITGLEVGLACLFLTGSALAQLTPIAFGKTVSAAISGLAEADAYTFDDLTGDRIRIRMSDGSRSAVSIDNQIQLYNPAGVELGSVVAEVEAVLDITLPVDGTYLILASDAGGNNSHGYSIHLQRLNYPSNTVPIAFGETVSAAISGLVDTDAYTFDGLTGNRIRIRMSNGSRSGVSIDNQIQLYDPAGVELGSAVAGVEAVLDITLPGAGTYLILASDAGANQTHGYGIHLQRLNNPGNTVPISFFETVSAAISGLAETDAYTFEGQAGDRIRIRMGDQSTSGVSIDNQIQLYDPAGVELDSAVAGVEAVLDIPLPVAGTYLILASDAGANQTHGYSIIVQKGLNNPDNTVAIAFGETVSAAISGVFDIDAYTFDG